MNQKVQARFGGGRLEKYRKVTRWPPTLQLDVHDRNANMDAMRFGGRIFSAYTTKKGIKIWIITEADRSTTTILLPQEY